MSRLLMLIFLSVLLVSCGAGPKDGTRPLAFSEAIVAGGNPLSELEMATALRICYAFRSKSATFRTELINTNFRFLVTETSCENQVEAEYINTTLRKNGFLDSDPLVYDSISGRDYFKEVQTDTQGHLKHICDQVVKGNNPLDVMNLAGETVEVRFYNYTNDEYELRYGRKKSKLETEYQVYKIERFTVLTNATVAGNKYGLISRSGRHEVCRDNPGILETLEQSFQAP